MEPKRHVYLIGMPGSGKSTVGRALASLLSLDFIDTDARIVALTGVSIRTIFEIEGEEGFRERESRVLEACSRDPMAVIATGGGAVLRERNRRLMRDTGRVIYLRATVDQLAQRTARDKSRPLLQNGGQRARLHELLEQRSHLYDAIADLVMDSSARSAKALAAEIAKSLQTASNTVTRLRNR